MQQAQDIQFPVIDALIAFAKDHFSHFGCLPAEFEYEGEVLEYDTYMALLSDDDLKVITGQAKTPYPLPEKMNDCGESFRAWKFGHFVPTYYQHRLYQAVYNALFVQDLSYTDEVYQSVVNALSDILTPELLSRNGTTSKVENGHFGMEIYYMREIVQSHNIDQCNRDALEALLAKGVRVGGVIKGPYKRSATEYSSMEVTGINEVDGTIAVLAKKRGTKNRWTFSIGAMCPRLKACVNHTGLG